MTNSDKATAAARDSAPRMLSPASRAVVAAAVVLATATSVWLADIVSSSPLPELARASEAPAPRLASALPTVTVVGRRDSLEAGPERLLPESAPELSSLAAEDVPSGRVKLRQ